jgi:heat shock protein HslJ
MRKTCLLLATVLLAAGCETIGNLNKKEPPPKPFVGTRWAFVLETPPEGEKPWLRFGDGRMQGFGGCNRVGADYLHRAEAHRAARPRLRHGDHGRAAPPARRAAGRVELHHRRRHDEDVGLGRHAQLPGRGARRLAAAAAAGEEVMRVAALFAAVFALAGCAAVPGGAAPAAAGAQSLTGTRWVGVLPAGADPRHAPRLEFTSADRLNGFTGCNMMSGSYTLEGARVKMGPMMSTKRFCVGPEMEYEKQVLAAMGQDAIGTREGGRLVFRAGGARYEFVPARD